MRPASTRHVRDRMTDPPLQIDDEAPAKRAGPLRRVLVYGFALALLGGCVAAAVWGTGPQWAHLREANPWDAAAMLGLVAASILLNGWIFWAMTKPFERGSAVGLGEMTALVAATCILNYLLRAGLISRTAYLKKRHGIGYRSSVVMLVMLAVLTAIVYAVLAGVTVWRGRIDGPWAAAAVGLLAATALAVVPAMCFALRWSPGVSEWFDGIGWTGAVWVFLLLLARGVDLMFTAGRLWLAARVFGTPIGFHTGVVMAAGGMFVTLATPLPNGLGVREGVYALMAQAGVAGEALNGAARGSAIGLIDRAAESAVFVVAGLTALAWLHKKTRAARPD